MMWGKVLALGPYRQVLRPLLVDGEVRHARTREGAIFVEPVFETPEGSSRSRELAECFGVDAWDFASHALDPDKADLSRLRAMFAHDQPEATDKLLALRDAGFRFFFQPNG